ncbi:MAG TPA: GerMN domain-containing protein [Acidimicrobiales bacterium]
MRRALLVATGLAVLSSCAVSTQDGAEVADGDAVPFALLDRNAPPVVPTTAAEMEGEDVQLCFVREGRLVPVGVRLATPVDPEEALAALASPPEDAAPALRTALADPLVVRDITVGAGVARVDLALSINELGGDDQLLAVAQIVCTLTARPGVGQVSFAVEGTPVEVPRGDGSLVSQPVSRDDYAALLA